MSFEQLIASRHACRAYLDKPVEPGLIRKILEAARWSPSGVNMQPWQVAVVQGASRERLTTALVAARAAGIAANPDYRYYPDEWFPPFKERRRDTGLALYQALEIGRDDSERREEAWRDNYRLFGAPVGLFLFLDRRLGQGSWIDMGMFMQSLMLAATELGLATCPQASLGDYPDIVREQLHIEAELSLIGGLALGYADTAAAVNSYRLERLPIDAFTRWYE